MPEPYVNAPIPTDRGCLDEGLLVRDRLGTEGSNRGDPEAGAAMGEFGLGLLLGDSECF
jgi:hypothetical protein